MTSRPDRRTGGRQAPTRFRHAGSRVSLAGMANVENLTYTGVDADQFVGTGNALANTHQRRRPADT